MFRTILVPTDGSDHAVKAVAIASDLAAMYRAQLVFLNVITDEPVPEELARFAEVENLLDADNAGRPGSPGSTPLGPAGAPNRGAASRDQAVAKEAISERILDDATGIAEHHGVDSVDTMTARGDPVDCIIEEARSVHADGIVMGSRGLSDIKGAVVGSVSHKVSNRADCTCIMVS